LDRHAIIGGVRLEGTVQVPARRTRPCRCWRLASSAANRSRWAMLRMLPTCIRC